MEEIDWVETPWKATNDKISDHVEPDEPKSLQEI